jgi:hypothetical protein
VWCDWRSRAYIGAESDGELDEYVEAVGLTPSGRPGTWTEIDLAEARRVVQYWTMHSLAYRSRETEGTSCDPFFERFVSTARYYTTCEGSLGSGNYPKTLHTFDVGVVGVDDITIGLVWFADED